MNYSGHEIKKDYKRPIFKIILVSCCLFAILRISVLIGNNINPSSQISLEDLYGRWKIDFEQSVMENAKDFELEFRSAYKYGHEMIFSENGDFSYYIGVGIGGKGSYILENNKICVDIITYEEGEIIEADFSIIEKNDMKYIVTNESDFFIYWLKQQ